MLFYYIQICEIWKNTLRSQSTCSINNNSRFYDQDAGRNSDYRPNLYVLVATMILFLSYAGLRGLMIAVMMSAIISSLTSVFNSAGSVFTLDIWTKFRPSASQRELLIVGRYNLPFVCRVCYFITFLLFCIPGFNSGS